MQLFTSDLLREHKVAESSNLVNSRLVYSINYLMQPYSALTENRLIELKVVVSESP